MSYSPPFPICSPFRTPVSSLLHPPPLHPPPCLPHPPYYPILVLFLPSSLILPIFPLLLIPILIFLFLIPIFLLLPSPPSFPFSSPYSSASSSLPSSSFSHSSTYFSSIPCPYAVGVGSIGSTPIVHSPEEN